VGFPISLITLTRDNPIELEKTIQSVSLQTRKPDTYFVVDSSNHTFAGQAKAVAEAAGAHYVWVPPEGIYGAMRRSVDLIPRESYSWWINASDWLAGRRSIELAHQSLMERGQRPSWVVGQLLRLRKNRWGYHESGFDGANFVRRMRTGRIGFPHPSTLFWTPFLTQVNPFGARLKIASDYLTALRFANTFGPPTMIRSPLAVHALDGLSAKRPVRNFLEKSLARCEANSGPYRWGELGFAASNAFRGSLKSLSLQKAGRPLLDGTGKILGENLHYCASGEDLAWPNCCDKVLSS
jgi:hypothetical protein